MRAIAPSGPGTYRGAVTEAIPGYPDGCTLRLLVAVRGSELPAVPGDSTAAEAIGVMEEALPSPRSFRSTQRGQASRLRGCELPCPICSGAVRGMTETSAPSYLAIPSALAMGGFFMLLKTAANVSGTESGSRVRHPTSQYSSVRDTSAG